MRTALLIARRELAAYLRTMSGYVIIGGMLFLNAVFFNVDALAGVGKRSSEVLDRFFWHTSGFTMVAAVLLSMRLLAEERQTGNIALLYSSPVRDWEIVVGKYLSALGFLALFLVATGYMPLIVFVYGKVSVGQILTGYLGLMLVGSATLALGTFGSSLVKSQVVAAILSAIFLGVLLLSWMAAAVADRPLKQVFDALTFYGHMRPFQQGLVHLKHVIYYVLVTYVGLFLATRVLEARRWK